MYCIADGHKDIVELLLNMNNIDVNKATKDGATPLYVASANGHIEIVELLLKAKNINANAPAKDGTTPLSIASDKGNNHKDIHKLLLSYLQDISSENI